MSVLLASEVHAMPCVRCGKPGHALWAVCADKDRVLCASCDIEANTQMLTWIGNRRKAYLIRRYVESVRGCGYCDWAAKQAATERTEW